MNLKCYIAFMLAFMDATSARRRRSQQCREDKLELKEDSDNVVFTGTVEKVYRAQSDVYRGVVRVKRVLRGDHTLTDNTVIIEGFGDPHICHSDVRERDTRIFLVNQLDNGHLRLNSSVIRVNVANLDKAAAAVRGLPLKERRPAAESLCEKMYCAYGAQCVVDQRIQRAYCRCQETCSDIFAPVCGSNGVTYSSDCQLRMASCTTQKRIFTKRQGPCDLNDPCLEKECFFGAQCNPFLDGRTAECICPEKCATYGGSRAFRPVCGTDGRDYPNVCEMRRASCLEMREIEVRYKGKCDPCEDITCFAYQVCQLDENRQPHCRCNDVCTPDYRPVCGSDGQTYTNECILRVESCKRQKNIRVIYSGECNAGSNPCDLIKCGPSQECDVDRHGVASCQCPTPCEPTMQPLCGSNGRTFDNECELKRQSCLLRQELTQIHKGECGEFGPCHSHRCSYGAICVVKSGQPVCDCPTCAEEFEPICGTDGISYTNICKMRKEACEQKTEILVQRIGLCNVCDSQKCDFYAVCESDSKGGTTCVCPRVCVKIEAAICGTDGVTYQNECELRVEACKQQKYIAVATRGPCERCHQIVCKHGARCDNGKCVCPFNCPETFQQVCASDNKTYRNACEMKRIGCQKSVELNILFYGKCGEALIPEEDATVKKHFIGNITSCQDMECKFGGICNFNAEGTPHCVCNFHCSLVREPVCGLDGKVYDNSCKLREESCKQQKRITPVAREVCSAQLDIPCEGNPPLIDASTQKQYFCGKGPGATLCPPKSYCHETEHFSTCCKETPLVKNCRDTPFGCCPDRKTPVSGPNNGGCPSVCNCDPLGAFSSTCDPVTKQCPCKPGVGGLRCDRCEPGFWGLHMISDGNSGCSNCNCNPYGSIRDDCDQMTGRCVCKHGIHSMKCDKCPSGTILGAEGCMDVSTTKAVVRSCEDLECYHGAVCLEENRRARCSCDFQCSPEGSKDPACGTDGNTYGSECQMKLFSCRYQKPISVRFYGHCNRREDFEIPTVQPTRKPPRRRIHMKRLDNKATREVTASLPENLFLTTSAPAPITATPPVPQFMALSPDLTTQVEIPAFSGNSYLVLYKLDAYTRLSLEIEFKTYTHEGIILYNGQTSSGPGDFVSLAIRESFLEFRYNLGSGPVILKSAQKIHQGEYYTVTAKRYLRDGMLSIEGQESVSGKSQGTLNSLDLTENLFVGMIPEASKVTIANVGIESGFKGCIRRLKIDRREVNLRYPSSREIMRGHDISECQGVTCSNMPCQNGGTCITQEEKFKCLCFHNYTGSQCESNIHLCSGNPCGHGSTCDVTPQGEFKCKCPPGKSGRLCDKLYKGVEKVFIPDFSNHSYLELTMMQNVRQAFSIEVWFLARDPNGVLLYNGQLVNGKGDFISLNLVDGFLQFRYNLGSGIAKIMSTFPIEMNTWNSVKISRLRRQGTLKMNNQTAVIGKSKAPLTELNLGQPLYIGGFPNTQILHHESGVATGFDGAIQRIALNGEIWDQLTTRAIQSHGVRRYKGPPCVSGSCLHGGMCIPELNDFRCRCTPKYTGRNCEKRIRKRNRRKALHFNGTTQLSFLFKSPRGLKRRKSNRIQIRFRASSPNGLLFWTSKGISSNGDYLAIALVDGYAEMGYNLGKTRGHYSIRSNARVDDEYWHTVTVLRKKKLVEIRIDKRQPVSNASETGLIDHNTNGLLWIGGSPKLPVGLPLDYYTKFEGCIDSITVDGFPLRLISTHTSKIEYCEHSKIR